MGGIAEDGDHASGITVGEDEGGAFDAIGAFPADRKAGFGLFKVEILRVTIISLYICFSAGSHVTVHEVVKPLGCKPPQQCGALGAAHDPLCGV